MSGRAKSLTYVLIGALTATQQFAAVSNANRDCILARFADTIVEAFDPMFETNAALSWHSESENPFRVVDREFQAGSRFATSFSSFSLGEKVARLGGTDEGGVNSQRGLMNESVLDSFVSNLRESPATTNNVTELVFLDRSVAGWNELLADLENQRDGGRSLEVVLLDSSRDGVHQITQSLSRYSDLKSVHIVSHGNRGFVQLGSSVLSGDTLTGYTAELSSWRKGLSANADILFYGCNLAATDRGKELSDSVSALTGADVASSDDLTGASLVGGDWNLEYRVGKIESDVVFSERMRSDWRQTLAVTLTYSGPTLFVDGDAADDNLDWSAADPLQFTANGTQYQVQAGTTLIHFRAGAGNDSVDLTGSTGDDHMLLQNDVVTFTTPSMQFKAGNVEDSNVDSGSGYDSSYLHGTTADDQFELSASFANVLTSDWNYQSSGFERSVAFDSLGSDTATFFDSPTNDLFYAYEDFSVMFSGGVYLRANSIDLMVGQAQLGGWDKATFYDTTGNDTLTGNNQMSTITNGTLTKEAWGFNRVYSASLYGGNDVANLSGSGGQEFVVGSVSILTFYGTGFSNTVTGFADVNIDAGAGTDGLYLADSTGDDFFQLADQQFYWDQSSNSITANGFLNQVVRDENGGYDTAHFLDTAGDDLFRTYVTHGVMNAGPSFLRANAMESMVGFSSSGNDQAEFYGTTGAETYNADATSVWVNGTWGTREARDFDNTVAYLDGGGDTVDISGTSGTDTLTGDLFWLQFDGNNFSHYVDNFSSAVVDASGGSDSFNLTDSTLNDHAELRTGYSRLSNAQGWVEATGFETQEVSSVSGGSDSVEFHDSSLNDLLYSVEGSTTLSNNQSMHRATGFSTISAYANSAGATDNVEIYGTQSVDTISLDQNFGWYNGGGLTRYFEDFDDAEIHLSYSDQLNEGNVSYQYQLIYETIATLPTLPQIFVDTTWAPPTGGQTWTVNAGDDLQSVLFAAAAGDTIVLEAGATFTGNFLLPDKTESAQGGDWIYIVSSELDQLPEGDRVTLNDAIHMPKIVSPNTNPALLTDFGSDHYRIAGVEIRTSAVNTNLVLLGWGLQNETDPIWMRQRADQIEELPHHITFDRTLIHSTSDTNRSRNGILADGNHIGVVDSYLANFKDTADASAIQVWQSAGPFKIENNFLEGTGENILFGGERILIPNMIPSDIVVKGNHFYKRLSWRNPDIWNIKNLFELKNAQRVHITGNVFENNWADAQSGRAILFSVRNQWGDNPWVAVRDVTFENNIVQNVGQGFSITGEDDLQPSQQTERILIRNNVLKEVTRELAGSSRFFQLTTATQNRPILDLTIRNNLFLHSLDEVGYAAISFSNASIMVDRFVLENNIFTHGDYGVANITTRASNYSFKNNGIILNPGERNYTYYVNNFSTAYPGNIMAEVIDAARFIDYSTGNFRLQGTSPFKNAGTDGRDLGPDWDELEAATDGVVDP